MARKEYSAGMVSCLFWFSEFRKVIQLVNSGKTFPEIKKLNMQENLFSAPSEVRGRRIFNAVSKRVKSLDQSFYELFENSDISNQKIITLIAVMESDSLFFDFMYEVYREKLIVGINELSDSDFRIFFTEKQLQSEKVAKWTDGTLNNLRKAYKKILVEAGILERGAGSKTILKPIMDKSLEDCMKTNGLEITLHALAGVR
jgi:hypothetical protein